MKRTVRTTRSTGPTSAQIGYAIALMQRAGYGVRYMGSEHKSLGATMRQRSGTVEAWLRSMTRAEVSDLIDRLKAELSET